VTTIEAIPRIGAPYDDKGGPVNRRGLNRRCELRIDLPIFIGFKPNSDLKIRLESLSEANRPYFSSENSKFLRLCRDVLFLQPEGAVEACAVAIEDQVRRADWPGADVDADRNIEFLRQGLVRLEGGVVRCQAGP